jgi:capsid protein
MDRQTAESRAMIYPGATACAYINESEYRLLRARSRAFVLGNPYWLGVQHSREVYTVGSGHAYKVVPKDKDDSDGMKQLLVDVMDEIELFRKKNRWPERQAEKVRRKDRDGEYFLRFHEDNPDGVLRVRFVEPLLVWTPPGKSSTDDVWFGIQFKGDYEEPLGYYIRPANYLGNTDSNAQWSAMVPADQIQHRTANVDLSSPRGLPTTYALQTRLDQALKTLSNTGAIVEFRARIALIRKHVNATASTVKGLLQAGSTGQRPMPGGGMGNAYQLPPAAILDTNDQTTYEFPTNDTQVDKIVAAIQAELRSVAAALGMAEYMVSADASNANFSSTMVAEGSPVKTFEQMQSTMIAEDLEVLERAILTAEKNGRLPEGTMDKIKIDAEPPVIVSRNRLQETQADEILNRSKVMSRKTWRARDDLDNDAESDQIEQERDEDMAYSIDDMAITQQGMEPPTTLKPDLPPADGQAPAKQPEGPAPK